MVFLNLLIRGKFEGVASLQPGPDFQWRMKVKCEGCGEVSPSHVYFSETDEVSTKGTRGSANLVIKCKFCSRENSMSVLSDSVKAATAEEDSPMKLCPIARFDCRGIEPVDYAFSDGWIIETHGKSVFEDVDLSSGEWCDYDDKAKCDVGIYELEHKFVKH